MVGTRVAKQLVCLFWGWANSHMLQQYFIYLYPEMQPICYVLLLLTSFCYLFNINHCFLFLLKFQFQQLNKPHEDMRLLKQQQLNRLQYEHIVTDRLCLQRQEEKISNHSYSHFIRQWRETGSQGRERGIGAGKEPQSEIQSGY